MSGFASIARGGGQGAGGSNTTNASETSQFGEALVAQLTPAAQATFVNGLNIINFITRSIGGGASVLSVSGSVVLQSGTANTGSASVQMRRGLTYRAGQGSVLRGTAIFGPPVANTYQLIGFGNVECGYHFGYQGTDFGILHVPDGIREVWKLDVGGAGVANGASVVVTLNGQSVTRTINGNNNENQTSWELSYADWSNVGGGFVAEQFDGIVYFIALRSGARNGTYSAKVGGVDIGTFTRFIAGQTPNLNFVSQSAWSIDTMDGNGPSRMSLDHRTGNVYQIGFQYLGFGNARFSIEDENTGLFQACHVLKLANTRTLPVLKDPHVSGVWSVANAGSTTGTHMTGSSAAIFCEGEVIKNIGPAFSAFGVELNVDNSPELPVLTIRSNRIFGNRVSYSELDISGMSVAVIGAGNHYMAIRIYKNLRLTGPVNFTNVNESQSCASYDTAATGFDTNQNTLIATYILPYGQTSNIDLKGDNFFLSVGESLTITAIGSSGAAGAAADVSVAITWFEDQ